MQSTGQEKTLPADLSQRKTLLFLIDTTSSMGEWITSLSAVLPSTIQSLALTRVFDSAAVVSYTDYDQQIPVTTSTYLRCDDLTEVAKLKLFASNIRPVGGGGAPEAWKTALEEIMKVPIEGTLFILHLTDAPPHVEGSLDREGAKEKEALGDRFEYLKLVDRFLATFPQVKYTCLTTSLHPFYGYLAQKTNGELFRLEGGATKDNITTHIAKVFNGWFGFDSPLTTTHRIPADASFCTEAALAKVALRVVETPVIADTRLTNELFKVLNRLQTSEEYLEQVILELESIINTDPLALCISPILGKIWRNICKRRHDKRRDELINLLSKKKQSLPDSQKITLELWLKDSYNAELEINENLSAWLEKNEVKGLLRFVPEDESLCAQQIVQLLACGDRKSTTIIRAILSRFYIDTEYHLPITVDTDRDDLPIPARSIPLNLHPCKLFEIMMHTVAPGSSLTRRYAAMIALHSIQCGSVLSSLAQGFLTKIKGKWINWKRRDDGTVENPDCWSVSFLNLILHPDTTFAITEAELETASYYRQICDVLRFYRQTEVQVKLVDGTSIDGFYDEHKKTCPKCNLDIPLTLITKSGDCVYCFWDDVVPDRKFYSVRCHICGCLYCRDAIASIPGYSKCYNCRDLTTASSPPNAAECSVCLQKFVKYYQPEEGLPEGKCKPCTQGKAPRKLQYREYPVLTHQVLQPSHFSTLCEIIGYKVEGVTSSATALYDAVLCITKSTPVAHPVPEGVRYREALVCNIAEIWEYVMKIMKGAPPVLPDCAICLSDFHPSEIIRACGRKGCLQRVCIECNKQWYGKNTPGSVIYQRATMCQFCCRVPAPNQLSRVDPKLVALATSIAANKLDPDTYYAWCNKCLLPVEVGQRNCGGLEPKLEGFCCNTCSTGPARVMNIKDCPECKVTIEKISGCNHIYCTSCSTHWCWKCAPHLKKHMNT